MCDDLFDDQAPEERTGERLWLKTSNFIQQEGFREGRSAGEEISLLDGFNGGFSCSTQVLFNIAQLRGEIGGILSLSLMKGGTLDKSTESQLQDLLGDVVLYETEMLNFNKTGFENLRSHSGASSRTELEAGEQLKAGVQLESGEQLETREQLEAGEQLGTGDAAHSAKLDKNQQVCNDGQQGDIGYVDLRLKQFKEKLKQLLCSEG